MLGTKRNKMIDIAQGEYVIHVDSDDRIEPDYIIELLKGIESDADIICLYYLVYFSLKREVLTILFFNKDKTAKSSQPTNKARISGSAKPHLVREAWWLIFTGLGSFLALILFTFNLNDASWSHSGGVDTATHNAGGVAGAWISDILLSVFGFSAWLWVLLAFYAVWLVYQRLDGVDLRGN